jgi:hypothetical protein
MQSAKPALHVPLQVPLPHVRVAMLLLEHTVPQPPQLFGSVPVLISHPSVCLLLLQSAKPEVHVPLQLPLPHVRVAMLLFEHTVPQPPQLFASVTVLISQPSVRLLLLQSAKPALQLPLQSPAAQVRVDMLLFEHALAQVPQLSALVVRLISQPSFTVLLQFAKPVLQAAMSQLLLTQAGVPFGVVQLLPHVPQLETLLARIDSQPSFRAPLQSAAPLLQTRPHRPPAQAGTPLLPAAQTVPALPPPFPQAPVAPQKFGFVSGSTQLPLQVI